MAQHTIGQLARQADVPTSTVRYYERRGLLTPDARSASNYRLYSDEALDRLRFVRSAQAAGFTLSDITALLRFRDDTTAPCQQVQSLIADRLDRVTEQLAYLSHVQTTLRRWHRACCRSERAGLCAVLDGLDRMPPPNNPAKSTPKNATNKKTKSQKRA